MEYRIERDDDAPDPRKNFDHAGTLVCFHPRFYLGDENPRCSGDTWLREFAAELVGAYDTDTLRERALWLAAWDIREYSSMYEDTEA